MGSLDRSAVVPKTVTAENPCYPTFRQFLEEELARRCAANRLYSMRAMARQLGLQSSYLSKLLRGERRPTGKLVRRLAPNLGLGAAEVDHYTRTTNRSSAMTAEQTAFHLLSADVFATISQWYHFAILELTLVRGFVSDADWIARELGIPVALVISAISRLKRLGLLEVKHGKLRCKGNFSNAVDPSLLTRAQQTLQHEVLRMAAQAMETVPVQERDQSSITVACPSSLVPEVKARIQAFRRELGKFIETSPAKPDRVYHLSISFYPVSRGARREVIPCRG